jgi:hypothetical protein
LIRARSLSGHFQTSGLPMNAAKMSHAQANVQPDRLADPLGYSSPKP